MPLARGRLSTITCCFSADPSRCAKARARTSVPDPGEAGVISWMVRAGQESLPLAPPALEPRHPAAPSARYAIVCLRDVILVSTNALLLTDSTGRTCRALPGQHRQARRSDKSSESPI